VIFLDHYAPVFWIKKQPVEMYTMKNVFQSLLDAVFVLVNNQMTLTCRIHTCFHAVWGVMIIRTAENTLISKYQAGLACCCLPGM